MPKYRVLCMSEARLIDQFALEAADDGEAVRLLKIPEDATGCELWLGNRLIVKISRDWG